jgi:hypothetical protein
LFGMSSDIFLSSIAGSPRRAGGPTGRRGICRVEDIVFTSLSAMIFIPNPFETTDDIR